MNAFKRYLRARNETLTAFAARSGLSVSTVHRAAEGDGVPLPETMRVIARETEGAVMPNDFVLSIEPVVGEPSTDAA